MSNNRVEYSHIEGTTKAIGRKITQIEKLTEKKEPATTLSFFYWRLLFGNEGELLLWDESDECCSKHSLTCDDPDTSFFHGASLLGFTVGEYKSIEDDYDSHDVRFVDIVTSKGVLSFCGHNEHNGYYSGIDIVGKWKGEKNASSKNRD
jgi:hypothetical protein